MKKFIKYGMMGMVALAAISCKDTLDTNPTETFSGETVWGTKATAQAFVNSTYQSVLGSIVGSGSCVGWEARTPNSVQCSQVGEGIDGVATELGISNNSDFGSNRFSMLRQCNMIIKNASESKSLSDADKAELVAQGRFLRGMVFFDQAKKMGRFVPLKEVLSEADEEKCTIPMTTSVDESYKHVIEDLEAGVAGLPVSASAGLANKYAAEVILSRACLQAYAYTKDRTYLDKAISAAKDVKEKCSLTDNYGGMFNETDATSKEILWGYYRLSTNSTVGSFDELIRIYPNISADDCAFSKSPQLLANKNGRTFECWGIYWPTQDLVDNYLVTDEATGQALPWYETSQYKSNVTSLDPSSVTQAGQVDAYNRTNGEPRRIPTPQDLLQTNAGFPVFARYDQLKAGASRNLSQLMYSKRDARFYTSVVYDGATWLGENVELNLGGNISAGVRDKEDGGWYNTVSGYCWRKNTLESLSPRAFYSVKVDMHYCIARTGEAYMNLAEAYLLKGKTADAVKALNTTRITHGKLAPSTATTEEEAWKDYIRERNVEMVNENGDIYFSYLRWGKYGGHANHGRPAGDIIYDLDRPTYKIEISRDRTKLLVGQITLMNSASRTFTAKRYLFPIAQGFLDTREAYGLDHNQNAGW